MNPSNLQVTLQVFKEKLLFWDEFILDQNSWGFDYFYSSRDLLNYRIHDDYKNIHLVLEDQAPIEPELFDKFKSCF
jgi:hypothetical protein